jgi:hypothetical protein
LVKGSWSTDRYSGSGVAVHHPSLVLVSLRATPTRVRAGVKIDAGCPPTPVPPWGASPFISLAPGVMTLMGRALLLRARRLDSRFPTEAPGHPASLACLREERVPVMREAQEVEDEEHEQILGRVCAIDVAKASGKVCTRVPHPSRPGARRTRVWDVDATTNAILELGEHLAGEGIEKVTLESTSDYVADLVPPAGSRRPGRAAGQRPGYQERPGQAQDGRRRRLLARRAAGVRAAERQLHPPRRISRRSGT